MGTSKTICMIARLEPLVEPTPGGRTHSVRLLGIGAQRSRGMKAGQVVDMEGAEIAARLAVDAAERMAGAQVDRIIVSAAGGRLGSHHFEARLPIGEHAVGAADIARVLERAGAQSDQASRATLHSLPNAFTVDEAQNVRDPSGMVGAELGGRLHVASCDMSAARNLALAVERSHLNVAGLVAAPYASGLATLNDEEIELGATVIDLGGGATTVGAFEGGALVHCDGLALGGHNVTLDVARGLTISLSAAERLKLAHGSAAAAATDDRETIAVEYVGDEGTRVLQVPRAQVARIIRPRIEEIFELTRDRLKKAGRSFSPGSRVVLTGGGSLLTGLPETARRIFGGQARIGRPLEINGLPQSGKNPAFAAAVGLLIYPQLAEREHFAREFSGVTAIAAGDGYFSRMGRWLRDSF
jgi:cell division protein FtsA